MKTRSTQWVSKCCSSYPIAIDDHWTCQDCGEVARFITPTKITKLFAETVRLIHEGNVVDKQVEEYLMEQVQPFIDSKDYYGAKERLIELKPPQCCPLFEVNGRLNRMKRDGHFN